ncbi:MAG: AmmeMemoRadiSam system protein B [Syntrophales bacterium]|nr:AmmeMemoRadiSam system protein B [Syntrophales bacterium]
MKENVRKAMLSGTWYPGSANELRNRIEEYAATVSFPTVKVEDKLLSMITPHAGLDYSGRIAAMAWKFASAQSFEAVILIGPSHRERFRGASVYQGAGYESPLGLLPLDADLAKRLLDYGEILLPGSHGNTPENSIELHVPFMQILLPGIPFVPVTMGTQDRETCEGVAEAIREAVGNRNVLVAASSDFSHFHNYEKAKRIDLATLEMIEKNDFQGFYAAIERGHAEACGHGPIGVVMKVAGAGGCNNVRLLKYENSGDITGDKSGVVGYAAVVFLKSLIAGRENSEAPVSNGELSGYEKKELLNIARKSIECKLKRRKLRKQPPSLKSLEEPRGAFVTLKQKGRLRGCIGFIQPVKPLHETVANAARSAAFDDPRFHPLTADELRDVKIEISVLDSLKKIGSSEEIIPGIHGLYVVKGSRSGLLLPQVAREHGWDRIAFLEETCIKAGLSRDAWREENTDVYVFSANVIAEDH